MIERLVVFLVDCQLIRQPTSQSGHWDRQYCTYTNMPVKLVSQPFTLNQSCRSFFFTINPVNPKLFSRLDTPVAAPLDEVWLAVS